MSEPTLTTGRRDVLRRGATAVGSLLLGGAATAGATGQAETEKDIVRGDLASLEIRNDCEGETVRLTQGTRQIVTHATETPSGRLSFTVRSNWRNVRGVGLDTGAEYVVSHRSGSHQFETEGEEGPFNRSFTIQIVFASGDAQNQIVTGRTHITITADGEVTSVRTERTTRCRA